MYTEAALFGKFTPDDMKLLVADFTSFFGTKDGDGIRAFCKRHGVPLAWGIGPGRPWPQVEKEKAIWLPFEPVEFWHAGRARLLDPIAGWPATNASGLLKEDMTAHWARLWNISVVTRSHGIPTQTVFMSWWDTLYEKSTPVAPLRGTECTSTDLCFGTTLGLRATLAGPRCICRSSPLPSAMEFVV